VGGSHPGDEAGADDVAADAVAPDALAAVRDSVLALVAQLPRLPSVLRVAAGDVTVEAEWPVAAASQPQANGAMAPVPHDAHHVHDPAGNGSPTGEAALPADRAVVRAPTVGSFFRSPKPGDPPFVEVGDHVTAGRQLAVVESMKLLFPVNAEVAGTVVEILEEDGAPVEHGEPLILLDTA